MARGGGTSPAFRCLWKLALAGVVLALGRQAAAQSTPPTLQDKVMLANRFRPFVMTSLNGNGPETFRPATWQWLVARSTLVQGYESYPCIHNVIRINAGSDDVWPQGSSVSLAGKVVDTAALSENQGLILEVPNASVVGVNGTLVNPAYALHLNDAPPGTEETTSMANRGPMCCRRATVSMRMWSRSRISPAIRYHFTTSSTRFSGPITVQIATTTTAT